MNTIITPIHEILLLEKSWTVCYYHVLFAFLSESTLCGCLNANELLAWNRRDIWSLSDSNKIRTHNQVWDFHQKKKNNNVIFYSQLFLGNWNVCQKINKPSIMTIFAQIWPDQHFPKRCVFVSFWQLLTPSIMQKFLTKMLNRQKERQMKEIP